MPPNHNLTLPENRRTVTVSVVILLLKYFSERPIDFHSLYVCFTTLFQFSTLYIMFSALHRVLIQCIYSVSQKNPRPPRAGDLTYFHYFHKRLRIFKRFLHTYYTFLSTLDYTFLFNYPQL